MIKYIKTSATFIYIPLGLYLIIAGFGSFIYNTNLFDPFDWELIVRGVFSIAVVSGWCMHLVILKD